MPDDCDDYIYGIDFGFNHATAITKIGLKDNVAYWKQLLHLSGLTNSMLIRAMDRLRQQGEITSTMQGYGDAAEPDRIEEINYPTITDDNGKPIEGFNVKKADKAVTEGIDKVKSMESYMTKDSTELIEEKKKYMWKVNKDGKILDEPVKANDDGLDAGRYAVYSYYKELAGGSPNIRLL
jgi:phage terminase large subunit